MTNTMRMDKPDTRHRLDVMPQGLTGQPLDRPEGPLKVCGLATYAHEYALENCAHGVLVRATIAKGRVVTLEDEAVKAMPGVIGVFTGERFLRNPAQGGADEAPVQGADQISYFGQPIALVVAESFEQARHGARALAVRYQATDDAAFDPNSVATVETPKKKQLDQGDLDAAIGKAAFVIDSIYTTPSQNSAAMEPHASIAQWYGDDLTLYGSYQMLKYNRNELADALGIDPEHVRILAPYVGGGFGSKLGIAPEAVAASLAARALSRPVKVAMSRPQVFEATMRRSETRQRVRLSADSRGVLSGISHEARVSNLDGEEFSEPVAQATHFLYGGENRRIIHEVVRLNRTCAGSMRAPGEAVGMLALENAMDELAHQSRIDPIDLRKRNLADREPEKGLPYSSRKLVECLDEGAARFGWVDRASTPGARREGDWFVGIGMAVAARKNILSKSSARVSLDRTGCVVVQTDMTDIGTGTYAILGQIAADMLGVPISSVEVQLGDTRFPPGAGSGGSWGAASSGSSVLLACEDIRAQICKKLGCEPADLTLKLNTAIADNQSHNLADLIGAEPMEAEGMIEPGDASEESSQAAYGAHFAEVGVNADTGEVRVRRMLGVVAAGRILNEKTARSQCMGGMVFGIGSALTEELVHDARDGHIVNHNLAEYHVPVNLDVPQLEVVFIEELDDWANPLQAKGIGELGISGAGAAITNAIFNACGVRVRDYPATLDKIFPYLPE